MKKFLYTLLLAVLITGVAVPPTFACSPAPTGCPSNPCTEYVLNVDFSQHCGWTYYGQAGEATGSAMCNVFSTYAAFGYNGISSPQAYQYVTLPTVSDTHWTVGYNVEVSDPHLSTSNHLGVYVYDTTTSSYLYYGPLFYGTDDPSCRNFQGTWSGNLSGHTLLVGVYCSIVNSDTHFYITELGVWSNA